MTKLTESDDLPSALLEEIQLYNVALKQEDGEQLSEDDISALYQVLQTFITSIFYLSFPRTPPYVSVPPCERKCRQGTLSRGSLSGSRL